MPSLNLEYPTKPFSKVNRYDSRASYSLETIHQIINSSPILHVSFTVPDSLFPMMLPMIGQMGSFDRPSAGAGDVLDLYLHGYVSSRIMNTARHQQQQQQQQQQSGSQDQASPSPPSPAAGLPLTVGATHVDGLVLSLTPNSHSYNYRSAVLFGHADLVTSADEKLYAMRLITDSVLRDRWRHTRVPPNRAEMQSTSILRVKIRAGSAKIRTGMPSDDKADMADQAVLDAVWTGVVPVHMTMAEPIAGPYNKVGELPGYLEEARRDFNSWNAEAAVEAATKAMAPKSKKMGLEEDD